MTQCQGKQYDDSPCPRQVVQGTQWCIFHYPNKDQELTAKFDDEFPHEFERQKNKTVNKFLDFTGFHFPSKMEFKGILPGISFKGSVFYQDVSFGVHNQICQIFGPVNFENSQFKGNIFFYKSNIQNSINFLYSKFEGSLFCFEAQFYDFTSFQNAEFYGNFEIQKSKISKAFFIGSKFKNTTHFNDTTFYEPANFRNTIFKDSVYFDNSRFQDSVEFQGTIFEKGADFFNTTFDNKTNFNGVKFNQLAHFDNSQFNEFASFRDCSFNEAASFRKISFSKGVDFTHADFMEDALFDYSEFKDVSDFERIVIHGVVSLKQIMVKGRLNFNILEWKDPLQRDNVTLVIFNDPVIIENGKLIIKGSLGKIENKCIKGVSLLNSELEKIEFINEEWPHLNNDINLRKTCVDEYLLKPCSIGELVIFNYDVTAPQVGQLYRRLRENYEKAKRYSEAGDFLIGEMEMRRIYDSSWYNRQLLRLYKELSLYGESIGKPLLWSGLLILLATGYITLVLNHPKTQTEFLSIFLETLPQVFMSFFPLGQAITLHFFIIKLLGSLLLGVMFIAVRRKLERR